MREECLVVDYKGRGYLKVRISIEAIPQVVLDEVCGGLKSYCVPICCLSPNDPDPRLRLIGSGTLVEIEGKHYILTAAHVWYETRGAEEVGLTLTEYPSYSFLRIPRAAILDKCLWDNHVSEWGPDIAILQLPNSFVSTIAAHKSFLNLPRQKATFISQLGTSVDGLWAITGMVGEFSEVQTTEQNRTNTANVNARAFFSIGPRIHESNGYDFLDISAKQDLPGVPSDFGGISGGGLWEISLSMGESGKVFWDGKSRHFRGIAFWQSAISDGRRMIRCHGPRSIFEKAWESWAFH